MPAAEEVGLLLQDKVRAYRAKNLALIAAHAESIYNTDTTLQGGHVHPRLLAATIEHGSWADDAALQRMWAGLLASSVSPDGQDDSNVIFTNLLAQLTSLQVRVGIWRCRLMRC